MAARGTLKLAVRLAGTALVGLAVVLASCGTLLYPERRGQPAGQLDPGVVVLDGVGLLLFLVPGVIAFVVDFATGAIYLPPQPYGPVYVGAAPPPVRTEPTTLTPQSLEAVVRAQTGKTVELQPGQYRAMRLDRIEDFTPEAVAGLEANPGAAHVVFRASGQ